MVAAVESVEKWFTRERGQQMKVLDNISFEIQEGTITCLLGPSGCGKTTLLNIVAGIETPDLGRVEFGENSGRRTLTGYVFQDPRLLPWKKVASNVSFALKGAGVPKASRQGIAEKYLQLVGLLDFKDQYPLFLSGGMRQRVGLARALAIEPRLVLMDEPFVSIDEMTATQLRAETRAICENLGQAVLFVTHNILEAAYMGDVIILFTARPARVRRVLENPIRERQWKAPEVFEYSRTLEEMLVGV